MSGDGVSTAAVGRDHRLWKSPGTDKPAGIADVYRLGGRMETVMVSPKFQVVIPRTVRESLNIRPGQKVQVIQYEGRIELIPVRPVKKMRGFLKGIDTSVEREPDRV